MQTVTSKGRSFVSRKALSKELRTLIVDKIISEGGNPLTGEFTNSSYSEIGRSVRVCHATVAKIWKQFCETRSISPNRNYRGRPSHLSYGDLCLIETLHRNDSLYKIWRTHNFSWIFYIKKIRTKLSSLTSAA